MAGIPQAWRWVGWTSARRRWRGRQLVGSAQPVEGRNSRGGGDSGVGGEELGVAVAEGDEARVGEVGEERGEEIEGIGRGGGVEEVEDA